MLSGKGMQSKAESSFTKNNLVIKTQLKDEPCPINKQEKLDDMSILLQKRYEKEDAKISLFDTY